MIHIGRGVVHMGRGGTFSDGMCLMVKGYGGIRHEDTIWGAACQASRDAPAGVS